jgi:endoglucanase
MKRAFGFLLVIGIAAACGGKSIRTVDDGDSGSSGAGPSGGSSFGGSSFGGNSTGGTSFGGTSFGGSSIGGSSIGGNSTGGFATGGFAGTVAGAAGMAGSPNPSLLRGMNLGNRLDAPNEGDWGPVLHASDFVHIAKRGFDHIRLPVRFNAHALDEFPYTVDETFLARVDWAVEQALSNGLAIIVDFHHYEEFHTDPVTHAPRFVGIWSQLATRYRHMPPAVVFELLNEPNGSLNAYWNGYAQKAIEVIRTTNPTRLLIVDAEEWAGPTALGRLALPADDPNVIATIHAYDPVLFTLQGAEFAGPAFSTSGVVYPGPPSTPLVPTPGALAESWVADWFQRYNALPGDQNPSSPAQVGRIFGYAASYMATTGKRVYNGEWGCTQNADMASRVRWMRDVRRESERLGMGWAVWDDGGGISLFNADAGTWNEELLATLFD